MEARIPPSTRARRLAGALGAAAFLATGLAAAVMSCGPTTGRLALPPPAARSGGGAAPLTGDPARGELIVAQVCVACHASGWGAAPQLGDRTAWAPRLAQGRAALLAHVIAGGRGMPARGNCGVCSRQDLADAIAYMAQRAK